MPITVVGMTSGVSATNTTSYATASFTASVNSLDLISIANSATSPGTANLIGPNTYNLITTQNMGLWRISLFRSMASASSAGVITIDFGGATQNNCSWIINEFASVDSSGTNGSGAIVQSTSNFVGIGTALTVTLNAFSAASNGAFSSFAIGDNIAMSPDTGWAEIGEVSINDGANSQAHQSQWRADNDTTAFSTWATDESGGGIALELKFNQGVVAAVEQQNADFLFSML